MKIFSYLKTFVISIVYLHSAYLNASDDINKNSWKTIYLSDISLLLSSEIQNKLEFGDRIRLYGFDEKKLWKDFLPFYEFALSNGIHIELSRHSNILDITSAPFLSLPVMKVHENSISQTRSLENNIHMSNIGDYTFIYVEIEKDGKTYITKDTILTAPVLQKLKKKKIIFLLRIDPDIKISLLFSILFDWMNISELEGFLIVK